MLAAAALVPETALLVPGAAGRAEVLGEVREAALAAVAQVLAQAPDVVVAVAPGPLDRLLGDQARPSLRAAGIPDEALGWQPSSSHGDDAVVAGPGASVAMLLLAAAGWQGRTEVVEVGQPVPDQADAPSTAACPGQLRALGGRLAQSPPPGARVGLVVAGSLSARHGPDAPLAEDPEAAIVDAALLDAIADAGPEARALLAAASPEAAQRLAISLWGPMQVLLGAVAADARISSEVLASGAPLGAEHVVATWLPAGEALR
ncbi:hypothetical protein [Cellulomonas chengniuliangii]|uniref:Extradiol ring-cleavage dioxygenase class III enzyme subunit B domain-containing protein n=1 Tax=Cellulomonas chengniuliangii TaxID=2968084 RepID=A0ABY5KY26_9CELL|nr:hypothetical protein [Cellulomonas chengniuliangii]MCC2309130.1 hypothetical protein [Cellulomonas chengniuliangii]MCC2319420.1 hypothetical protein [Cellulomonas chengniuliangii]UUI74152.1 hypothetical protein NP064_09970 [Cellulomonas chengniuliangii]